MPQTVYVASNLQQWQRVDKVNNTLRAHGIEITYDWTPHAISLYDNPNAPDNRPEEELAAIGEREIDGILRARYVLTLLPGGRGTHFELGLAYMNFKRAKDICDGLPICLVMGQDNAPFRTSFHYVKEFNRVQTDDEGINKVLEHFGRQQ